MIVYLVDGTYELFRAYYGAPSRINAAGQEVGACRTLGRSLLRFMEERLATHVALAFDHVIESFRNDLFPGYKDGEGIHPSLLGQFELAERLSAALGICYWPMIEFEADDALATAAFQLEPLPSVEQIRLCTPDKDLLQCVSGTRVVCWDRQRDALFDEDAVCRKFGVMPHSIPDYLALVGDSADGIPGIPRWGAKAAATVLAKYRTLEHIPPDPADWLVAPRGRATLGEQLSAHQDAVHLYRRLATLRRDVPLDARPEAILWRGPDERELTSLAMVLEDPTLLERANRVAEKLLHAAEDDQRAAVPLSPPVKTR